jgi:hypothetical protein
VTVEPPLILTPIQATLLGHLAAHPGVVLGEDALAERVQVEHGPTSRSRFDAELHGLSAAISVAAEVPDALERLDGTGWRLKADVG